MLSLCDVCGGDALRCRHNLRRDRVSGNADGAVSGRICWCDRRGVVALAVDRGRICRDWSLHRRRSLVHDCDEIVDDCDRICRGESLHRSDPDVYSHRYRVYRAGGDDSGRRRVHHDEGWRCGERGRCGCGSFALSG